MIQITPQMRILVAVEPTDFRRGIDGLARVCKDVLRHDPFSGWVFVFRNRPATALKILVYRRPRFLALPQALSSGQFRWWPAERNDGRTLAAHQLQVLLAAGDPEATQAAPAWRPVTPAVDTTITERPFLASRKKSRKLIFPLSPGLGMVRPLADKAVARESPLLSRLVSWGISPGVVKRYHGPSETDNHRVGHG